MDDAGSEGAPHAAATRRALDQMARRQRGRLIGMLVRDLGHDRVELAEDVAQEAILAALSAWPYSGLPDHPEAWLARVARNKAIDRLRRGGREAPLPDPDLETAEAAEGDEVFRARVPDPSLRLAWLCCHAELDTLDRLALVLRIVSGFTAGEIAQLLLITESGVAQRLVRARKRLQSLGTAVTEAPGPSEIALRTPLVLRAVYLMFSLGNAPRSGDHLIGRDLMDEAIRLARALAQHPDYGTAEADALAALLCLQGARADARVDDAGRPVLLRDQDRSRWDRTLIEAGVAHLQRARSAHPPSRYHVEAAIAASHTLAPSWEACDWNGIVTCYEALARLIDSPVVRVNGAVARAWAGDPDRALGELDRLARDPRMADYAPFHLARAEVRRLLGAIEASSVDYRRALEAGTSAPVAAFIEQRLATCL